MLRLISTILFLFFVTAALAQNVDTLLKRAKAVYNSSPAAGVKLTRLAYSIAVKQNLKAQQLKSLNAAAVQLWDMRNNNDARIALKQGLALATKYGIDSLTADLWITAGLIDFSDGLNSAAIAKFQKAIAFFEKGTNKKKLAIAYVNLGICYKRLANFEQANSWYFKAAEIFELLHDDEDLCGVYNSIGNCFLALKKTQPAIGYYKKAFALSKRANDKYTQGQSLNNIGYGYQQNNQLDSSIKYLTACIKLRAAERDSGLLVLTLQNLGAAWKQKGDVAKALRYLSRSVSIATQYTMREELARGYLDLAELHIQQRKFAPALNALNAANQLAIAVKSPELRDKTYVLQAVTAEKMGEYQRALHFQKLHDKLSDSLFSINQQKTVAEIATRFEVKQKDRDIAALHEQDKLKQQVVTKQHLFIEVLIVATILTLLVVLLLYRSYRQKRADHLHIQFLMKELHHRVKNNLQMLSGLFSLQLADANNEQVRNSIRENELRINSMNIIHQKLYDTQAGASLNIREYINDLVRYIQVSYNTAARKIDFVVEVEPLAVAVEKTVPIGLIINELITNCCKYAFTPNGGTIKISFKLNGEKQLILTVADNGMGKKHNSEAAAGTSFGTRLVEIMAQQLNAKLILTEGKGLEYVFEIPD